MNMDSNGNIALLPGRTAVLSHVSALYACMAPRLHACLLATCRINAPQDYAPGPLSTHWILAH